jgi:Uma2 family endonuclease
MGMPAREKHRWTAREVRQLTADAPLATPRYELVDGELLVTPSPSRAHQEAVKRLLVALTLYLDQEQVGSALASPSDIELEADDLRQPDVFVLPAGEAARLLRDDFPARELLAAVEVVSPSSARYDRVDKRALYQRRVPEYWIVDTDARLVERWRAGEERPEILTEMLEWLPAGALEPLRLDLKRFFAQVHGEAW